MTSLHSLLSRLSEAKKGSRSLDGEIAYAVGWNHNGGNTPDKAFDTGGRWTDPNGATDTCVEPPDFTTSLDAAMTLVPEGWRVHSLFQHYGTWSACLHKAFGKDQDEAIWKEGHHWPKQYLAESGDVKTAPLAVVSAALRARQSEGGKG